jgi:hypothetical protein
MKSKPIIVNKIFLLFVDSKSANRKFWAFADSLVAQKSSHFGT